ncbi:2-aminoadipate transaminase [Anaerotignum neopropionicum]|uniref:2-aminoadipate transaminase n=1 Tax=Anaerotignum neopropionicum TaxID=36847 RepID=A0A136WCJ1_9FIRM|nr:PLP-dependent aminotransferase family protein [Anaerotignum neopropionicum]KXL52233.1 2-aminoadipate transaminase [Anaerotignum neopropionicum]
MVKYANRMNLQNGSEIRDMLKVLSQPEVLSFAGGMPAKEMFPVEKMMEAAMKVMKENGADAMQYSSTEGFLELREQIADRMVKKQGVKTDADHILITPGSQMGLDFSAKIFLDKDDVVLLESPSYLGAINAFKTCEPRFIEIPTEEDGMIMSELEKILDKEKNIKFIYVIPDFQNPTGREWSLQKRKEFIDIINKYEVPVIEDNPYGELRFEGESMPTLKSFDTKGLVVYLGTFSKILAPGYRLAWVCASTEILEKYNLMEQAACLQSSTISQMETARYIRDNDLDAHVAEIIEVYRKRRNEMMAALDEYLPKECKFTRSRGGLFTWVVLPEYMDAKELQKKCLERKVAFVPGSGFYPNGNVKNTLRLNYSTTAKEDIHRGMKILGEEIKKMLK